MEALLEAIVGAMTPARARGRSYLRKLLKEGGVLQLVPDACVQHLVEQTIRLAKPARRMSKASPKSEMAQMLDGTAAVTIQWIRGGDLPVKEDGYVPRALVKFGVQRGARTGKGAAPSRHHVFQSHSHFRDATVTCAMCGWCGQGRKMKVGEVHEDAQIREYHCPKCGGGRFGDYLAVAPLPPMGESQE